MKLDEMEKEGNIDWWEFQEPQCLEDRELYCLFAGYGVQYILLITILLIMLFRSSVEPIFYPFYQYWTSNSKKKKIY